MIALLKELDTFSTLTLTVIVIATVTEQPPTHKVISSKFFFDIHTTRRNPDRRRSIQK